MKIAFSILIVLHFNSHKVRIINTTAKVVCVLCVQIRVSTHLPCVPFLCAVPNEKGDSCDNSGRSCDIGSDARPCTKLVRCGNHVHDYAR